MAERSRLAPAPPPPPPPPSRQRWSPSPSQSTREAMDECKLRPTGRNACGSSPPSKEPMASVSGSLFLGGLSSLSLSGSLWLSLALSLASTAPSRRKGSAAAFRRNASRRARPHRLRVLLLLLLCAKEQRLQIEQERTCSDSVMAKKSFDLTAIDLISSGLSAMPDRPCRIDGMRRVRRTAQA